MSVQISGKWVTISDATLPTGRAAPPILSARLHAVEHWLPLAAHESADDVEYVHRLRVSCRRADAAVRAFGSFFARRKKGLRRWLRRLRRSAGPARDIDVLVMRLRQELATGETHRAELLKRFDAMRARAQPALVKVDARARRDDLAAVVAGAVAEVQERADRGAGKAPFGEFAARAVGDAARGFRKALDIEAASFDDLHRLRIKGKRLRYAIELFHSPLGRPIRNELYPLVEELQDRLGAFNDHVTAQQVLQQMISTLPASAFAAHVARRIVQESDRAKASRDEFNRWWTEPRRKQIASTLEGALQP